MKRAILIVMDGCGAGEAPDAARFNDHDRPSTLRHVWEFNGGLNTPTLSELGLWAAAGVPGLVPSGLIPAQWGRLQERSEGKDSVTGHWEMMGIITAVPFPTYPEGFPDELMATFEKRIGRSTLGNVPASGTEIIEKLGKEHCETGKPIVYTSADSVFQIACHEEVVPVDQLYEFCRIARELCVAPNNVERVIARPFVGTPGAFIRTGNRRDFPLDPPPNLVNEIGDVYGIGVVPELFAHRGFREIRRTRNNAEHAVELFRALASDARFIFANFEDFDMLYGHRNNPAGFGKALEDFDGVIKQVLTHLGREDLLLLTADHGNDPTTASTDHSREYVPLCAVGLGFGPQPDTVGMDHVASLIRNWLIG